MDLEQVAASRSGIDGFIVGNKLNQGVSGYLLALRFTNDLLLDWHHRGSFTDTNVMATLPTLFK